MDVKEKEIIGELNLERMKKDAAAFSKWERYSGSEAGETCVDYMIRELQEAGVSCERCEYELLRSLPVEASITVEGKTEQTVEAIAAVYSGDAREVRGEIWYDEVDSDRKLSWNEQERRFASMKGKIVLTYDLSFQLYYEAARAGAIGVIAVWPKDLHHHDTMGGVWGMPGSRDRDLYPYLPYVQILGKDAEMLLEQLKNGFVSVRMNITMDNRVVRSSIPVARISGKSKKYVLLSGHYDSWYEGMTDNGAANVLMMEIARVLQKHQTELNRSVVIAWWSGHSDARYSGSTWYCDHYYEDLRENCVAHINMDICGCKGSNAVRLDMTGMEGTAFNDEFLKDYNRRNPLPYRALNRSSDQTFWGTLTPVSVAPQFFVDDGQMMLPEKSSQILHPAKMPAAFGEEGPFFWWHTKEDTLDKIGDDVLMRDCEIGARLVLRYCMADLLPIDMMGFTEELQEYFEAFQRELDPVFDVSDIIRMTAEVKRSAKLLLDNIEGKAQDQVDEIFMRTAGNLVRLKYTYSSPYYHDYAVEHDPYGVFASLLDAHKDNTPQIRWVMLQTDFIRQKNRMVYELKQICDAIELQLYRWNCSKGKGDGVK